MEKMRDDGFCLSWNARPVYQTSWRSTKSTAALARSWRSCAWARCLRELVLNNVRLFGKESDSAAARSGGEGGVGEPETVTSAKAAKHKKFEARNPKLETISNDQNM